MAYRLNGAPYHSLLTLLLVPCFVHRPRFETGNIRRSACQLLGRHRLFFGVGAERQRCSDYVYVRVVRAYRRECVRTRTPYDPTVSVRTDSNGSEEVVSPGFKLS